MTTMKRLSWGAALGLVALLLLDAVAARMGLVPGAIPTLDGPALWTTSRALAVTAFVALTLDVVFGLFVSTGAADRVIARAQSVDVHRALSSASLGLTLAHAAALLGDRTVRFDLLSVMVPFASPYRPWAVAAGVFAVYAAALVHGSFALRGRLGAKSWRRIHYLSFALYLSALVHGITAGSDTGSWAMRGMYLASALSVAALSVYRATLAIARANRPVKAR
jgi:sulfoxide reductase heme-binding subunit YedZ